MFIQPFSVICSCIFSVLKSFQVEVVGCQTCVRCGRSDECENQRLKVSVQNEWNESTIFIWNESRVRQ